MFYYKGKGYKGHIVVHSHYAKMLIGLIGFECYGGSSRSGCLQIF